MPTRRCLCQLCVVTGQTTEAGGLGVPKHTLRQRLREWYDEAAAKWGAHRQALAVAPCLVALLGWIVRGWQGTPLVLALAATTLGDPLVLLAVSVVYPGCAMPVAWVILRAGQKHAWRGAWRGGDSALDRHRLGGARAVGAMAVAAHSHSGLASLVTDQHGGQFTASRGHGLVSLPQFYPATLARGSATKQRRAWDALSALP